MYCSKALIFTLILSILYSVYLNVKTHIRLDKLEKTNNLLFAYLTTKLGENKKDKNNE